MLLLLCSWIIAGVMAKDWSVTYYQLRNSSVCLRVLTPPPYYIAMWKLGGKVVASDRGINPDYAGKVSTPGNWSLCINKLMDTDAGIYEFTFLDSAYNAVSERHQVIVEETVPKPKMIISALNSDQSAGLCSITVNCSIQDDWLWVMCDRESCRDAQRSFSKVNITISTDNSTVVCSGENHVSKNNVSEEMCFYQSIGEHKAQTQILPVVVTLVVVCLFLCGCTACLVKRLRSPACNHQKPQSEPRRPTSFSSQAEPSYENVDVTELHQTSRSRGNRGWMQGAECDVADKSNRSKDANTGAHDD